MIRGVWKPKTWYKLFQYINDRGAFTYSHLLPYLGRAQAVLSVGGDNYSLDYGLPSLFTTLDDIVLANERPMMIWGASIGPFTSNPSYERYMSNHLRNLTAIFARESNTLEYLESIGVNENVHPVADPAFLMEPVQPKEEMNIEDDAIGLNLSPLMAKFVTGGDPEKWIAMGAAIIAEVARRTEREVYLIPHVTSPHDNDYAYLQKVVSRLQEFNNHISLVPPEYSAAEIKWLISQLDLFAGSRMHATIAALSSGVPTLSFSYSIKSQGINRDLFDHTDYCLYPNDLAAKTVAYRIASMLNESTTIKRDLTNRIPKIQEAALNAGMILRQLLGENGFA